MYHYERRRKGLIGVMEPSTMTHQALLHHQGIFIEYLNDREHPRAVACTLDRSVSHLLFTISAPLHDCRRASHGMYGSGIHKAIGAYLMTGKILKVMYFSLHSRISTIFVFVSHSASQLIVILMCPIMHFIPVTSAHMLVVS